jgi:hypothetical protein
MKNFILLTLTLVLSVALFGQAKKPTIMVVPSDNWCLQNGFVQEFDNQGKSTTVSDYRKAIQGNYEILSVIAKINELMADRGFPLKNLETTLKSVENQTAEDAMMSNRSGDGLKESPIDILRRTANAGIWIQVSWNINTVGPKKSVSFTLQGLDAYSNKQIAGASGTGKESFSADLPLLLEEAVLSRLDNFNSQLQNHFNDMFDNGREVALRIRVWDSFSGDLESEYEGKELSAIIEDWVHDNTVQHRFNTSNATENLLVFEQVRIPLYDNSGKATDTRRWARDLQKFLKDNYKIESKVTTKGLGEAQLIIGEK